MPPPFPIALHWALLFALVQGCDGGLLVGLHPLVELTPQSQGQ